MKVPRTFDDVAGMAYGLHVVQEALIGRPIHGIGRRSRVSATGEVVVVGVGAISPGRVDSKTHLAALYRGHSLARSQNGAGFDGFKRAIGAPVIDISVRDDVPAYVVLAENAFEEAATEASLTTDELAVTDLVTATAIGAS